MNVIAIGGEPATGKSTLVQHLLQPYTTAVPFEWGLLGGLKYDAGLFLLGRYEGGDFGGTDRLPMNVIDDAEEFIEEAAKYDTYTDWAVLFEGDRLFNDRFLDFCAEHADLHAYILTAPPDVLEARHDAREDDQSESWLKGRRTKYANLAERDDVTTLPHETVEDTADALATLQPAMPGPELAR